MSTLPHAEFVAAYRSGALRANVDRRGAADFVSARLLLPFALLPLLGVAVALALAGLLLAGVLAFVAALALRQLVRASSPGFVLTRALTCERFYREALAAGVLRLENAGASPAAPDRG